MGVLLMGVCLNQENQESVSTTLIIKSIFSDFPFVFQKSIMFSHFLKFNAPNTTELSKLDVEQNCVDIISFIYV